VAPSYLISCSHSAPEDGYVALMGKQGGTNPAASPRCQCPRPDSRGLEKRRRCVSFEVTQPLQWMLFTERPLTALAAPEWSDLNRCKQCASAPSLRPGVSAVPEAEALLPSAPRAGLSVAHTSRREIRVRRGAHATCLPKDGGPGAGAPRWRTLLPDAPRALKALPSGRAVSLEPILGPIARRGPPPRSPGEEWNPLRGDEIRALRRLQRESEASPHVFASERGGP
jgi:hypothetical protein